MDLGDRFINSEFSIEDLEQFRDENGFIDLSKANIEFTQESREIVGNQERIKNWIKFNGTKTLVKGENIRDTEKNYGIYAELIVEEIAKQLGIETAHYDLVKTLDNEGNETLGVMSVAIADTDKGEQLISLHDIIGDEPIEESDFADTTSYEFTVDKLRETLLLDGYSEEIVENVICEYKKRAIFTLAILDVDNHTENIAFIKTKENGVGKIKLSPVFDSEASLMLDNDISTIGKLLDNFYNLKDSVDIAHPKIGTLRNIDDGGFESFWKDTFDEICEDDEIFDYYTETLQNKIDMDVVLDNVESRIKAPLPENVRLMAKYSYDCRNEEMNNVLGLNELEQEEYDVNSMLSFLVKSGTEQAKIRESEQLSVGKQMEKDMQKQPEQSIEDLINNLFDGR